MELAIAVGYPYRIADPVLQYFSVALPLCNAAEHFPCVLIIELAITDDYL